MTAEEFLKSKGYTLFATSPFKEILVEFAQHHVKEALQAASEKVEIELDDFGILGTHEVVNKESILNAYPLENIK